VLALAVWLAFRLTGKGPHALDAHEEHDEAVKPVVPA